MMLVGILLLSNLGLLLPYWMIGLGLLAVGYGFAKLSYMAVLLSTAPDEEVGAASSSNSVEVESSYAAGMALSFTLAKTFTDLFYFRLGTGAGLSSGQILKAVDTLRSDIKDALITTPLRQLPKKSWIYSWKVLRLLFRWVFPSPAVAGWRSTGERLDHLVWDAPASIQ